MRYVDITFTDLVFVLVLSFELLENLTRGLGAAQP